MIGSCGRRTPRTRAFLLRPRPLSLFTKRVYYPFTFTVHSVLGVVCTRCLSVTCVRNDTVTTLRYVSNLVLMQQSTLPFLGLHQTAYDTHYAQAYMRTQPATITEASPLRLPSSSAASWNRPGNCRCSYKGCSFAGSQKTLEVHMMDRHLIYPPGWEKRPRKSDWDADPTMKG